MRFFDTRLGRCATLLALGGGIALYAQGTQTASATVTVVDRSGSPVANARVRLTSPSMMAERTGATNSSGVFVARLLPPGTYTIEVIKDGFQTTKDVRLIGMDQNYQPRIVLQPVGNTTVEIVATSMTAVDPTDVKTATNYSAKRIDTLPTGRAIDNMAMLTPGVTSGVGSRLMVRGAMTSGNLYLVDGQNLMDNAYNNLQYPVINDSIEETQVITGAISAEYGNVDGGVLNTITKSGGNELSGMIRVNMSNPAWNAVKPYQDRNAIANIISEDWNYTLGGYILKDKLWFYVSYLETDATSVYTLAASAAPMPAGATQANKDKYGGAGASYNDNRTETRLQTKLTYLVNQDHYIVLTYNQSESANTARNAYSPGDLRAVVPQENEFSFWNLSWRATWSPSFTTEVRFGTKHQNYTAGRTDAEGPRIYNYQDVTDADVRAEMEARGITGWNTGGGLRYQTGTFDGTDGGDNRDNNSANLKGSWFTSWNGTHEVDFGLDYYKGWRQARNAQSPWHYVGGTYPGLANDGLEAGKLYNITVGVHQYGYLPDGTPVGIGDDIWNEFSTDGNAEETTIGLYINDKWKLNNNFAFQVGVRYDQYESKAADVGKVASASGISPRLGVTYDVLGDQTWIVKASYCVYNSAVLENLATASSGIGKTGSIEFYYVGPGSYYFDVPGNFYQPMDVLWDRRNYDINEISYWADPKINYKVNPNMHAPKVTEMQLSGTYSFDTKDYGKGYVTLTYVDKSWSDLLDYHIGDQGTVNPYRDYDLPADEDIYIRYYDNEPDSRRDYKALEFQAAYQIGNLNLTGSITWSELLGNYEGEADNSPASAQGLHVLDANLLRPQYDAAGNFVGHELIPFVYDYNIRNPYGPLQNHRPIVMRWAADYTVANAYGRTVFGFVYRFDAGAHYSIARNMASYILNPDVFDYVWNASHTTRLGVGPEMSLFGQNFTQYRDNQRRTESFNTSVYHDLSITHDFNLFKVAGYQVSAFAKLIIYNFFNHQQLLGWATNYNAIAWNNPEGLNAPWTPVTPAQSSNAYFGYNANVDYWGAARSFSVSAGIRF